MKRKQKKLSTLYYNIDEDGDWVQVEPPSDEDSSSSSAEEPPYKVANSNEYIPVKYREPMKLWRHRLEEQKARHREARRLKRQERAQRETKRRQAIEDQKREKKEAEEKRKMKLEIEKHVKADKRRKAMVEQEKRKQEQKILRAERWKKHGMDPEFQERRYQLELRRRQARVVSTLEYNLLSR